MFVTLKKDYLGQKAGATLDIAEEQVSKTLIVEGIAEAVQGDPYGPIIARAVESSVASLTKNLDSVITATLKQFADAQARSRKNAAPLLFGTGDDGRDPKGKTFGDWCLAVARNDRAYLEKHYGSEFVPWQTKAALGDSSGATGGYTVPPEFYSQLVTIMEESTFFRQRAFLLPMASATLQIPYLDITTVESAGVTPFFGGVQMSWTAEAQTRTETEPAFKQLELKANELSGYSVSSNILLQDAAFGLEKFLYTLFGRAIAWYEEYAFLQGNGVGKPMGVLNSGALVKVTRAGGANTSTLVLVDVAKMFGKMLPSSQTKCIWVTSPSVVNLLLTLADAGNRALFLPEAYGGFHQKPQWTLLGLPVFITEKAPALGSDGDLMLLDPSLYVIGDRQQIEITASEHANFLKNQMTWRVVERIDGQPWMDKYVTLQDGSTTVSPFVALH
jgi:HK97 family phage major capsid protein